jgi:hypothetical protein
MNIQNIPKLGDTILIRVSTVYGSIKSVDDFGYDKHKFIVIGHYDGDGFLEDQQFLITPSDESIFIDPNSVAFARLNVSSFTAIKSKSYSFINNLSSYDKKLCIWVYLEHICEVSKPFIDPNNDGCFCKVCSNWYPMAESNQADGTLICWLCRQYPIREFY